MKPWRLVAIFLLGALAGAPAGAWFYVSFLHKPTTVVHNQNEVNQKIKGRGNATEQSVEDYQVADVENTKRNKSKRNGK